MLSQALTQEMDPGARRFLAASLRWPAGRLEPAEADRVCAEAARLLSAALARETDEDKRFDLAMGLAEVAKGLRPAEAARLLHEMFAREKNGSVRWCLVHQLAEVARGLGSAEAARWLNQLFLQEKEHDIRYELAICLPEAARPFRGGTLQRGGRPAAQRCVRA